MNTELAPNALRFHQCIGFKEICRACSALNNVRAVDLAYKVYGPSPTPDSVPILVLHGFLGCMRNWQSMCKRITGHTNRTVIAVDARNHGDSPHTDSHSYIDLAADVSKLITKLGVQKCTIIGHSMGGRTGMVLALSEPSKVSSQVIVDISPHTHGKSGLRTFFPKVLEAMTTVNFQNKDLAKAQKEAKNVLMAKDLFSRPEHFYFILMNIGKLPDNSYGWKCNVQTLKNDFHYVASFPIDVLQKRTFNGPMLFIAGSLSKFIPPDDINEIQRFFPKAVLKYVEDAGHNVHAENPNAFFTMVTEFLANT
uniref:sn-1-specific diacylglycerol lipase ABHD11 n=1 Tax=Heliothis virescens TaxID=7102 RepID=A0A2A4JMA9_HELVI